MDLTQGSPSLPPAGDPELPEYSTRVAAHGHGLTERTYQLEDSKGHPWVWLTVQSRAPSGKQFLLYSGDAVTGSVEVDFDRAGGVKEVSAAVIGGITAVGQEELVFVNIPHDLWNSKAGSSSKPRGKLSWPFSIALPREGALREKSKFKDSGRSFPLPPSFSERASPAYVDYRVLVTVRRGAFKGTQTLSAALTYLPVMRADPPSHLRQIAYEEGSDVLGPDADPDGWKILSPIVLSGKMFDVRQMELQCTLAIAKPLSYARGSHIPVSLTLTSPDEQALDLLATPSAIRLLLVRIRALGTHAMDENVALVSNSNTLFRDVVGSGCFWQVTEDAPQAGPRVLRGELALSAGLKPSFVFPTFSLRYAITLLPFQAPGFSPSGSTTAPLLLEHIVVTSAHAVGPVPRSYAPPGYVHPETADYNISAGFLENGNQRFLHHHGGLVS